MFGRLTSAFSLSTTPAETPPRGASPTPESSQAAVQPNPDSHAGRVDVEEQLAKSLRDLGVPTSEETSCSGCADPCDDEASTFGTYPKNFEVDWTSDLLGSSNPAARKVTEFSPGDTCHAKHSHS